MDLQQHKATVSKILWLNLNSLKTKWLKVEKSLVRHYAEKTN